MAVHLKLIVWRIIPATITYAEGYIVDRDNLGRTLEPTRACTKAAEGKSEAVSAVSLPASARWQTGSVARGTPTAVVPPTPPPSAGAALVAGAKPLASLKSLSFTLTAEEGGEPLMAGLEAAKIEGDVVLPDQLTLQITEPDGEP